LEEKVELKAQAFAARQRKLQCFFY